MFIYVQAKRALFSKSDLYDQSIIKILVDSKEFLLILMFEIEEIFFSTFAMFSFCCRALIN